MSLRQQLSDKVSDSNSAFLLGLDRDEQQGRTITGTFFSRFETICETERVPISPSSFPNIRRTPAQGSLIYPNTANDDYLEELSEARTGQSDSTNTNQKLTKVDFLFNTDGEKAHLLSNAPVCHLSYTHLAKAATGHFPDSYWKRRKLLNGMNGRSRRMNDSGVKHSKYNKIHLFLQREYFDSSPPALLIVPLLSLSGVKDWDGVASYEALAISFGPRWRDVSRRVLANAREICSQTEIMDAIQLLRDFVKDIAESLIDTTSGNDVLQDFDQSPACSNSTDPSITRWKRLVHELRGGKPRFAIPKIRAGLDWGAIRVAKGRFDCDTSCLPDPFLVTIKAAINFSSFVEMKLMPACPSWDDTDSDGDVG